MERKQDIRRRILAVRDAISQKDWEDKSLYIQKKVLEHSLFSQAEVVYCYMDYHREVGTEYLIRQAWKLGKKVAVPKVSNEEMNFFYLSDFSELQEGYRGIYEPSSTKMADVGTGLLIMPGVAFDRKRNRIGYGKGFYDRYLKKHQNLLTIGLAFECQIVPGIPAEVFDYCPNIVITEENIYESVTE